MAETAFDVRDILDSGRKRQAAEDDWVAAHEGALSASQIGGCLRREKFRLMAAPRGEVESPSRLRRLRWGHIYQHEVWRQALNAGRRPRRDVPLEAVIEGVVVRGMADLVFSEGVVECKTTSAYHMHADHLPFAHRVQLGTYQFALKRAGQLLYGNFHQEWAFDYPSLPDVWEPWVREAARLFRENPDPDPLPYPPERLYCQSCPYLAVCPTDDPAPSERPLTDLETQIVERYLSVNELAKAAEKRAEEARAGILGLREVFGTGPKGVTRLRLPGRMVLIRPCTSERIDYSALTAAAKAALPSKTVITHRIQEVTEDA